LCLTALPSAVTFLFVAAPVLFGQATGGNRALQAASVAERSGRYEEAAALYQQFLSRTDDSSADPSTLVHARTRLATAYFLLHRYRESLEAVAPLTSNKSRYAGVPAQAWLVDGLDRLELGQLPEAIASFERTLALNPASGTARLALGDAFVRSGRLEEAAREYEEQTRATSVPDAWYKLGLAYARLAAQVSEDFTQKFPASAVGQQLAAEALLATGDDQGAAGVLLRLLRQVSTQPQSHADFGAALLELGYTKAAEDQFREELSQDPDCPLARLGLAETASLRGDWEGAVSSIERAARSNARELARLLELPPPGPLRDAWRQGKVRLPPRLSESPGGKLWKSWLGNSGSLPMSARADAGRSCSLPSSKAASTPGLWLSEACYQRLRVSLRSKKPLSPEERIKLAEAEFRLGGYQAARRQAKQVLESNPRNEWGVYWLSKSYDELAQSCFSKVASLNPESARVHQMLGDYYARRHNLPRAKAEYVAAIQLAPDLPDLHLGLGTVCWADGEWTEAEKELERTLELAPGSAVAHYELGNAYVQQRRWQSAIDHLRRIVDDPAVGVKARLDLATAEAEMGQVRRAIEELLPVAGKDQDGEIHYRLAALHRKLGEKDQAQEALATFKRLQNASPKVDRRELEALDRVAQSSAKDNDR
jgi:tetratricopeptide (TPR) repeat protein